MFQSTAIAEVDAVTASQWLDAGNAVMIDIREQVEHDDVRVPGITLNALSAFNPSALPNATNKKLLILCHSGKRAGMLAQSLIADGSYDPVVVAGGIMAWRGAGLYQPA